MSAPPLATLTLYRHILKAAKHFPSVKKSSIIREIKHEFRANKASARGTSKCFFCTPSSTHSL
jgi:hypothetical protein